MGEINEVIAKVISSLREVGCNNIEILLRPNTPSIVCVFHSKVGSAKETLPLRFFTTKCLDEILFYLGLACIHYRYLHKFTPFLYVDKHYRYIELFINNHRIIYARYNSTKAAVQLHTDKRVSFLPVKEFISYIISFMDTYPL